MCFSKKSSFTHKQGNPGPYGGGHTFIKKDEWPRQSPDCNPMDYAIWDSLKDKVYQGLRDKLTKQVLNDWIIMLYEKKYGRNMTLVYNKEINGL